MTLPLLSTLGKDELLGLGRALQVEVAARMTVDEPRDAIARSKRASIEKIVDDAVSRDLLNTICEVCGLDASGNENQPLVMRIVAASGDGNGNGNGGYAVDRDVAKPSVSGVGIT